MLSKFIAPVLGLVVSTSTAIALDGVTKQIVPTDLKAVPAFAIKVGAAVIGGLAAARVGQFVVDNVESVIATVKKEGSEEVSSSQEEN